LSHLRVRLQLGLKLFSFFDSLFQLSTFRFMLSFTFKSKPYLIQKHLPEVCRARISTLRRQLIELGAINLEDAQL